MDAPFPDRHTVAMVMREDFITVEPEEKLLEARRLMRAARLRHVVVARAGTLVGLVSYRDVIEGFSGARGNGVPSDGLDALLVAEAMRRAPDAVGPGDSLRTAALRLLQLRVGCLPVVRETPTGPRLVGLVTESDLLRAAYDPWFAADGQS